MRILIIEDEKRLAQTLAELMRRSGFQADTSGNGRQGLELAKSGIYDAIILDVMLPEMDGFAVLAALRAASITMPVLMLTARGDLSDRVRGLNAGADYYLSKPFDNEELLACLRAILRRGASPVQDSLQFADLALTLSTSNLSCGTRSVSLSGRERDLMELLMRNTSQLLSKDRILGKVWGYDAEVNPNCVEAYLSFLRKKLTLLDSCVHITVTRGLGYKLEETHD
ncbi:MAG: response regulator transcription factor [Clostridiales bacterium]|nr:response regulator transcription factor [Clostridiales bacterium]